MSRIRQTIAIGLNTRRKKYVYLAIVIVFMLLLLLTVDFIKGDDDKIPTGQLAEIPASDNPILEANRLARMAKQQNNIDLYLQAIAIMRRQVEENPTDDHACVVLGRLYLNAGMFGESLPDVDSYPDFAREMFDRAREINPRNKSAYTGLANYYRRIDKQKALENYITAYELDPSSWNVYFGLGMAYFEAGKYDEAKKIFTSILEYARANNKINLKIQANEYLGRVYLKEGAYDTARQYLETSAKQLDRHQLTQDTNRACPYQALGKVYSYFGKSAREAINLYKAADLMPSNDKYQFDAAMRALKVGDYQNAVKYIDRAIALSNSWWYRLAKQYILLSRWFAGGENENVDEFNVLMAATREMTTPEIFNKALHFLQIQKFSNAHAYVDVILTREDRSSYHVLKGFIHLVEQHYEEAEEEFNRASEMDPEDAGARIGKGHLNIVAQDYNAAVELFTPVAAHFRSDQWQQNFDPMQQRYDWLIYEMTFLGLGWAQSNQNRHEEAITYFDLILKHRPKEILALLGKGNSLIGLNRLVEAEKLFLNVLDIESENSFALTSLGTIMLAMGEEEKAERYFVSALEIENNNDYSCPYEGLGLALMKQGRTEEAKDQLERAIDIDPNVAFRKFNALAEIYMQEGRYEEAEKLLLKSIQNNPSDDVAKELLEKVRRLQTQEHMEQ